MILVKEVVVVLLWGSKTESLVCQGHQSFNYLVERARRPARAPKAVNEIGHQFFFLVLVPTLNVTSQVPKTILAVLVGRCVYLMCSGLVERFWL